MLPSCRNQLIDFNCKSVVRFLHDGNIDLNQVGNYMFKVNKRNTRTGCELCSKLTLKKAERRNSRRSGVFIVNFEHILHLVLVFLLLTLSR